LPFFLYFLNDFVTRF